MSDETTTAMLHATDTTLVRSSRVKTEYGSFTSLEIGSLTIFAPVELLRRIADEATKAAMIADGWSRPPEMPAAPPVFEHGAPKGMPNPADVEF